jgi:dihydrodipicolinate reductase
MKKKKKKKRKILSIAKNVTPELFASNMGLGFNVLIDLLVWQMVLENLQFLKFIDIFLKQTLYSFNKWK